MALKVSLTKKSHTDREALQRAGGTRVQRVVLATRSVSSRCGLCLDGEKK